ncbi:hypothetical protein BGZ79_005913 [Entomortierella chlamydospora]|nr:hypothetical protein BGZ79_005913 [Entomortierella chlamydospora]
MAKTGPTVMIAGAGIGGLFLGLLLERQNIPYMIYERAPEVRPLGSTMGFGANILPVFEQLGILEDAMAISHPVKGLNMMDTDLNFLSGVDFTNYKEQTGYSTIMFPRPKMYAMLQSHIPPEKIMFSKRVLSIEQNEKGVMVRMADGTTYHGDILVGADGTHSAVRQGMFKRLDKKGLLPATDKEEMKMGNLCMVGTTNPVDPEKFPGVKRDHAFFERIINEGDPYTWHTVNMPGNRICWGVTLQVESAASTDVRFRNSDWGPEADDSIMHRVYENKTAIGGIVWDLIENTPKSEVSKIFLEEKLFETWYDGRTVLIGDACHKFLPTAGQGAVNAMQDAVILANCIYEMGEVTPDNIAVAFKEYYNERYEPVKRMMAKSKFMAILQYGQASLLNFFTWKERAIRHVVFNWVPKSIQMKQFLKDAMYRPQASFLEYVENRGTTPVLPQKSSQRYLREKATEKGKYM